MRYKDAMPYSYLRFKLPVHRPVAVAKPAAQHTPHDYVRPSALHFNADGKKVTVTKNKCAPKVTFSHESPHYISVGERRTP
jgi:hypothetical protein